MDYNKIFATRVKELEIMIQTKWIYSQDIVMKISIEEYGMLIIKNWKRNTTEGLELPNQEIISALWVKENCIYEELMEKENAQIIRMKKKKVPQKNKNTNREQVLLQEYHQSNKTLGNLLCKITWNILKMDVGGSQIEQRNWWRDTRPCTKEMAYRQYVKKRAHQHWGLRRYINKRNWGIY